LLATFDSTDATWRVYVNGALANSNPYPGNVRAGPQLSTAPWIIGTCQSYPFFGELCDIRIWSSARIEEQIKK
jgi:hypothetical protein